MQKSCFSYPVEFVEDVFGKSPVLAEHLVRITGSANPKVLIVADMNVVQRTEGLGAKIGRYVQEHGIVLAGSPVVISGGEKVKADNLQSALKIVSAILAAKLGRNDVVLALGGGTVLDVAGYAAAQVRGGMKVVRLPTTPAAMMDAAFAEYAAVDSATVKDALRIPSSPAAVVIDFDFALSVLDGVWRGGISEAVRHAVVADAALLRKVVRLAPAYRDRSKEALSEIVESVVASRAKKGATAFAQWSALRLESMSGYKLPHGYAVAIGICIDLCYAVACGSLSSESSEKVIGLLRECGALDGLVHSGHLLGQADSLLLGLSAWSLSSGSAEVTLAGPVGKSWIELEPKHDLYKAVLANLVSSPAQA